MRTPMPSYLAITCRTLATNARFFGVSARSARRRAST